MLLSEYQIVFRLGFATSDTAGLGSLFPNPEPRTAKTAHICEYTVSLADIEIFEAFGSACQTEATAAR